MINSGREWDWIHKLEREDCIQCGIETQYLRTDPIDERSGYIEGAGQLCNNCYKKL